MRFSKKKFLTATVVAFLSGMTAVSATSYTSGQTITGTAEYADGDTVTVTAETSAVGFTLANGTGTVNIGSDKKGTVNISAESTTSGYTRADGITVSSESGAALTVNGNVNISSLYSAGCFANGIAIENNGQGKGVQSSITINGNVAIGDATKQSSLKDSSSDKNWGVNAASMHGGYGADGTASGADNYSGARWSPTGVSINATGAGSTIDLNGSLYIAMRGTALATDPYNAADGKTSYELAVINANKGDVTIYTPESTTESYYAAASYGGTININMNDAKTAGAGHNVVIQGNLFAMKGEKEYFYQNGRINLALDTASSSWTGIIDNSGKSQAGEVNLWLRNGATWTHKSPSKTDGMQAANMPTLSADYYGKYNNVSYVENFHGGATAETAGNLFAEGTQAIQVADYEGYTNVYYSHTGNGETKASYTGGDITIAKAEAGSNITLITDSTGITMTNEANVAKVLNALASKLIYSETDGTNLTGTVKIADGLTSSSAALKTGAITFTENGTGSYVGGSSEPVTYKTGPITESENIGETRESGSDGIVSVSVTEAQTGTYQSAPSALYTGDNAASPLVVDLQGHTLKLATGGNATKYLATVDVGESSSIQVKDTSGSGVLKISAGVDADGNADNATNYTYGIYVDSSGSFTADVDTEIDGVKSTGSSRAFGIYVNDGCNLAFNKNLTIKNVLNNNTTGANTAAVYTYGSGSSVMVKGNLTIEHVLGTALRAQSGTTITTAGGTITVPALPENNLTYGSRYILQANKGTINLNTGDGITPGVLTLAGDMKVTNYADSVANVNLTAGSTWTGAAVNTSSSSYNDPSGTLNLTMAEGSTWTHETGRSSDSYATTFAGSNISKLEGTGGTIVQNATAGIKVYNYSGNHTVIYSHDAADPTSITGGNFTIKNAAEGSSITLITDNTNITGGFDDSSLPAEKNNVSEILNKLAQKLYYTANDGKLSGTVKIASGLTASSAALKTGAISFSTSTTGTKTAGQGFYDYTPVEDTKTYKTGAITESESINLTRELDSNDIAHVTITEANASSGSFVSTLYAAGSTEKASPMTVNLGGKGLALTANSDNKQAAAIYVEDNSYIQINNSSATQKLAITATNTDTRAAHGIYAKGYAQLTITGPVEISNIQTAGDSANGISIQGKSSDVTIDGSLKIQNVKGTRERGLGINASGINVTGEQSSVTVTGAVDISGVRGAGIKLTGADTKVSVGGGTITAAEDADKSKNFSAVRVQQGQLDINMKEGVAGTTTTKITGDMYVTGQYGKKVVEYSGGELIDWTNAGVLNVALTDKDSFWTGVAAYDQYTDSYGESGGNTTHDIGELNLYLQNGATWTNEKQSHVTTTTLDTDKQVWAGSTIANLYGGSTAANAGVIFQKDENPISIVNYSGHTTVLYAHDENNPTSITGGNFSITNAAEGSTVTLITDNTGLSSGYSEEDSGESKNKVNETLNQLAQKLFYKSYTDKHLTATVKIADGLTASSTALKVGDVSFSTSSTGTKTAGQGYYEYTTDTSGDFDQTTTEFTTAITGNAEQDAIYKTSGVLKDDGSYVFTKDGTTITPEKYELVIAKGWSGPVKGSAAISGADKDHNVTIDLKNHNLTVNTTTDTNTTGISAISGAVVEVNNAGAMSITAESTGTGQTAALFTNWGGTIKIHNPGKVLTLRAKGKTPGNVAVIKTLNEVSDGMSSITIDGLVDVLADKGSTSGANEAISAVASKVEIGGGTIKAVNGAAYAIRAYGEFVSSNRATVNVNVVKDEDGKITGAGDNKVELEGNIYLGGGMDNGGSKADVSVGLNTKDSYWKGNVSNTSGNSSGIVNLYMGNGATWTGNNLSGNTVNAILDNATWTGYGTGAATNLTLKNGATWNVTGSDSKPASKLASLSSTGGHIFMAENTGDLTISDYSGSSTVYYAHDETDPTKILGGNLTIAQAKDSAALTLITDNTGLTAGFKNSDRAEDINRVSEVLNKLAQKLYYTANDGKLSGTVKIADGLTASSASLKTGTISFSTAETGTKTAGQGFYDYTPADDSVLTAQITGGNDAKYQTLGIETTKGTYDFTADTTIQITKGTYGSYLGAIESSGGPITVNADGVKLDVSYTVPSGSNVARAVATASYGSGSKNISVKAKELNLTAKTTGFYAQGVYAYGGTVSIDAATTISASAGTEAQGIYAGNGGTVNMTGNLTVKKGTAATYYALKADGNGVINANVKDGKAGSGIVKLDGDIFTEQKEEEDYWYEDTETTTSTVNLALSGADSSWTGRSLYAVTSGSDTTTDCGYFNLWLSDGATWTNQGTAAPSGFAGSRVTKFVGGDSAETAGNIFQNDKKPLTIDNYSGNTNIYYAHTGNGEAASDYTAGNTVIKSAAAGSAISLITDNTGVTMDDEDCIINVLNALAGKLYYSNYVNGETNLSATVKIADGLTASSKSLQTGEIEFQKDKEGQGRYKENSITPGVYPESQTVDTYTQVITGDRNTDKYYRKTGVLKKDGTYQFTTNPSSVTTTETTVNAANNDVTIQAPEAALTLENTTEGGTAISVGTGHKVSVDSKDLTVKGNVSSDGGNIEIKSTDGEEAGKVTIDGDLSAKNNGTVNVKLAGEDSSLTGGYTANADDKVSVNVSDGATWTLTDLDGTASAGDGGAKISGGESKDAAGNLYMQRSDNMKISDYSGWLNIYYDHENEGKETSDYTAGNVEIGKIASGSGLILSTNDTLPKEEKELKVAVEEVLTALAPKLKLTDAENQKDNLGDKIMRLYNEEGLTSSSVKAQGEFEIDENGYAQYVKDSVDMDGISAGDYETFVMKGVRSAAMTSFHAWRDNMSDTYTAADFADLEDGIFAKILGGKTKADIEGLQESNTYKGIQVGYDKALKNGWHMGAAFDYRDGDSDYLLGGTGEDKLYSFGVYGVKRFVNNSYVRVAAKVGHVKNEYDVYNETRNMRLHGDYGSTAYGLTAEYGKVFQKKDAYITPKLQLTWARVGGKDYTATTSTDARMDIFQDAYNSFVGRIGAEAGLKKAKGGFYGALYLAHEFGGDINSRYYAEDGGTKSTSFDGADTWAEFVLGGRYNANDRVQVYADFARDFGGDFEHRWKLDAGVRFSF